MASLTPSSLCFAARAIAGKYRLAGLPPSVWRQGGRASREGDEEKAAGNRRKGPGEDSDKAFHVGRGDQCIASKTSVPMTIAPPKNSRNLPILPPRSVSTCCGYIPSRFRNPSPDACCFLMSEPIWPSKKPGDCRVLDRNSCGDQNFTPTPTVNWCWSRSTLTPPTSLSPKSL